MERSSVLSLSVLAAVLSGCVLSHPISRPAAAGPDPGAGNAASAAPETSEPAKLAAPAAATTWQAIGRSVQGRPIRMLTLGEGPRRVLWVGGIHGNEREGHVATRELPAAFAAAGLGERITLTVVEDLNPDGSAADRRQNANGVDLNRNFPSSNFRNSRRTGRTPLDQPEARLLHELIMGLTPDLVVVLHSWRGRKFINYDGPARALAEHFGRVSGYPLVESDDIHPTPGSLGSWVGRDLGLPILTVEFLHGMDPDVAWHETRDALLAAVGGEES